MILPVRSTYRAQLHPGFTFDDAIGVLDHLHELGISHLYSSPVLEAVPGSMHGYDVVDHSRVREALGGAAGLRRLVGALRDRDMGWIVDLVPNHVSVEVPAANPLWWDLLTHGRGADSARWFDVDWDAGDGRVVLPVLGAPLDDEVADGTIELRRSDVGVVIGYHDLELPTAPGTASEGDIGAGGDRLRAVLDAQHHRPSHWRAGDRNYRVFFDIDSLAAVRVEDDAVFDAVHARLADWVAEELVDGVRIDHVDGLADPTGYLERLRGLVGPDRPVWVEKILSSDESLPRSWPVDGTTGYEFARLTTGLAVDPRAEPAFDELWAECGGSRSYEEIEWEAKREAVRGRLVPELRRVVATARSAGLDVSEDEVVELVVAFGAYRTYGRGTEPLGEDDARRLDRAVELATSWRPDLAAAVTALAASLRHPADGTPVELRTRFQQLSSPAMAKGAEDTAFYRHHRFVALAEVGGDPGRFGVTARELHEHNQRVVATHPRTMLTASTHDTKRSADVRARLAVLSQRPQEWTDRLRAWRTLAAASRPSALDSATELLVWQTIVGAWPIGPRRLTEYLTKATREAGVHTEWTDVDDAYEAAVTGFAADVVGDARLRAEIESFVDGIAPLGRAVRLAEIALRLTSPGIPDTYQGDHDWDRSLVDPDNRRPVDHDRLQARLSEARRAGDVDPLGTGPDSLAKLWVTARLLQLRSERPDVFAGPYEPLDTEGRDGVIAYRRDDVVVAVDARPGLDAEGVALAMPAGEWGDALRADHRIAGGRPVPAEELWPGLHVAVLLPA